jgi:hypothetical protein
VPHIIVTADRADDRGEGAVMLRERINLSDFESRHFASQLVERLGWAVGDAHEVERLAPESDTHGVKRQAPESSDQRASASVVTTAS